MPPDVQAAVRRTDEWNAERRRKRLRIGQNSSCHEAAARLKSCLLFYLGNEGKRRFTDSNLHLNHKVGSLENFHDAFEALFQNARDYTVEQIKLYSTIFMLETDSFSSFLAPIAAQAALCNWPQDQERDTFIAKRFFHWTSL